MTRCCSCSVDDLKLLPSQFEMRRPSLMSRAELAFSSWHWHPHQPHVNLTSMSEPNIVTVQGASQPKIQLRPPSISSPLGSTVELPSPTEFEIHGYLLQLKLARNPKFEWATITKKFSVRWSGIGWTADSLRWRWSDMPESKGTCGQQAVPATPQPAPPSTVPSASRNAPMSCPAPYHAFTNATTMKPPPKSIPAKYGLQFNFLSKTWKEYVPMELSTLAKCIGSSSTRVLGIAYYGNHPIRYVSVLGTVSSVENVHLNSMFTIANGKGTELKCASTFAPGSTQPTSDEYKHTAPSFPSQGYSYLFTHGRDTGWHGNPGHRETWVVPRRRMPSPPLQTSSFSA
ncbi:hypothetical protein ACMFMG_005259 [Clarireedia jacksonii]